MNKEAQNGKAKPETNPATGFDPAGMFQSFMSNFSESSTLDNTPAAGILEMNQHWLDFLGERFKQDAALLQKLSKCTNPAEMSAVHMEFYKETTDHYQREIAEMTELGQQAIGQLKNLGPAGSGQMQAKKELSGTRQVGGGH